jgi:hypothetical protein|tara:strand:- start:52 stop:165 length:114 start_codon:yes stop_codon:yes gene_type:complete
VVEELDILTQTLDQEQEMEEQILVVAEVLLLVLQTLD